MLSIFSLTSYSMSSDTIILPIEISDFRYDEFSNSLIWEVESEVNFSHFNIQKSEGDPNHFEEIGSILGSPYDLPTINVTTYYRLQMVDLDGTFVYSDVVVAMRVQEEDLSQAIKWGEFYDLTGSKTLRRSGLLLVKYMGKTYKVFLL